MLLLVVWGPAPAFRNIWWIVFFAVLLAFGVTMLRRETALEFPGIERGDALPDYQAQPADVRAGNAAAQPLAATETTIGTPRGTVPAPAPTMGRVRRSSDWPRFETAARSPATSTRPRRNSP